MAAPRRPTRSKRPRRLRPASTSRSWKSRKRDFQQWIFDLTLAVMVVLVTGFIISAVTTRSGVVVTVNEQAQMLSTGPLTLDDDPVIEPDFESGRRTELEILNGVGIPGLAGKYTDFLRDGGFDVLRFTNAQRYDYPHTLVINRGSDYTRALDVARRMGVQVGAVENMPDADLQVDVTIVLGQDYRTLISYRQIALRR